MLRDFPHFASAPVRPSHPAMSLRLVLIEDHQALREGLELLLECAGIEVVGTAGTASDGRELIETLEPDVALVDIRLGEDSGIDLTAQDRRRPRTPVVLYTGSSEIELLISGLDSGARGYALKEGTQSELSRPCGPSPKAAPTSTPACAPRCSPRGAPETEIPLQARARDHGPARSGPTGEQVAERLFLSPETIKTHIRNAMNKLEANTRVHAIAIALREGFISSPGA